jgi:AcrR family transcriptional regulator
MEEVARSAGVGIGTLYRHFPNRSDLVVDVYRTEISKLVDEAHSLAASKPPLEALRSWLLLFVDHLADNIVLGDAVKALAGEQAKEDAAITDQLNQSLNLLFERPIADGTIADPGIEPLDFLRALYGVATASPSSDWYKAARRMVDVLIAGLRPTDAEA